MTINFLCRASKARKDGKSPIEMSVIIGGERTIITLDRKVTASKFNPSTQKVKGDKDINEYLDVIRKKCYSIEVQLIKNDMLSIKDFVEVYKNGFKGKKETLLQIYDMHNELYKKDVLSGRVDNGALKKYRNSRNRLAEYMKTLGYEDIKVKDITPSFCTGYHSYCLMNLKQSTTNKELKMFKRILQFAVNERYIDVNPFQIRLKEDKKEYHPLTVEDITKMWEKKIDNERLSQIRDMFILQCYTGLAYIDMATFTKSDVVDGVIIKKRHKTDVKSIIPILPIPKAILERYDYKLPIISNQKYNVLLKALGELCGITVNLTSHLARHSFATLLLNKGVDMKTVSMAMGHSNSKITEKVYAEMRNQTVVDNILKVM
jgi:site-specific recombinase XerD